MVLTLAIATPRTLSRSGERRDSGPECSRSGAHCYTDTRSWSVDFTFLLRVGSVSRSTPIARSWA